VGRSECSDKEVMCVNRCTERKNLMELQVWEAKETMRSEVIKNDNISVENLKNTYLSY